MKQIGFDARFYSPTATGIGRHVSEVIDRLSQLDHKNQYAIFLSEKNYAKNAAQIKALGKNFTPQKTTAPHYSFAEQTTFLNQLNKHHFDLVIFPQFNVPYFYRRPYIVTIHDLTIHKFPGKKSNPLKHFLYKKIIKNAAQKSQKILAVSANTKKDIIKILTIAPQKIDIVYNGISPQFRPEKNPEILTNFRKKYQLPETYLLYTGVMRSHKNILGLVRAYAKFTKKFPKKNKIPHLVIAGPKDDLYFPEIEKLAHHLKINSFVKFTGFFPEEDFATLFSAATAFVFPSFYEGFGIPPLEAMSVDLPVVCSNTSSLPEACGDAVLYFDPQDTEAMAKKMSEILDEKIRKDLIIKGQKQWKKFSWEKVGKKYFENIQHVLTPA
jgi:glycosyltransferase involved in cell wall biosynthesis